MGKSSEALREKLRAAFETKAPSKMELHRKTGIPRPSIDGYLRGAVPDLDALDAIADALDTTPWELLRPPGAQPTPVERDHELAECYRRVAQDAARRVQADTETRKSANTGREPEDGDGDAPERDGEDG